VRPERVVLLTPAIEAALLLRPVTVRWASTFAFQREVHALVSAVLVRGSGLSKLGQDAEPDPPDGQRGETPERLGGEGDAVIGADPPGQAILAEEALEDGTGLDQLGHPSVRRVVPQGQGGGRAGGR
jgi:hypothetical protein